MIESSARERTASVELTRHRFTVDEYYRMAEAGILHEDSRVELIDGEILDMSPIGPRHANGVRRLSAVFFRELDDQAVVSIQNPIRIGERNEPEPDLVLARHSEDEYRDRHPTPEDVLLVVEVADTSSAYDRETKAPLYARAGIADSWIADVGRDEVIIHRDPIDGVYTTTRVARRGQAISPLAFLNLSVAVDDILG